MTKYVPCLKLKQSEVGALETLKEEVIKNITPLFDIPRTQKTMTEIDLIKRIDLGFSQLSELCKSEAGLTFYIDNFDIDDDILLGGSYQYRYILNKFSPYKPIPVLAIDRHPDHNKAAIDSITSHGGPVALRLQVEDIDSYDITKLYIDDIWKGFSGVHPSEIHLIIDFRRIKKIDKLTDKARAFLSKAVNDFNPSRMIVTGSIIPAVITELMSTNKEEHFDRLECHIWGDLRKHSGLEGVVYGDYGVVSPDYSDAEFEPWLFRKISAPKVFYPYADKFYAIRGISFQSHALGNGQYFDIAEKIAKQLFFRKEKYSYGDKYVNDRSHLSPKKPAKAGHPASWIKATLSAHITFIASTI